MVLFRKCLIGKIIVIDSLLQTGDNVIKLFISSSTREVVNKMTSKFLQL